MFGIGLPEMIIIAVVALIFIGPDKLPGVLRSIGKAVSYTHLTLPTICSV